MKRHDVRELGMDRSVSRRDFLNGVGVALTGTLLPPSSVEAFRLLQESEYYPPTRTGMRGSHPGSFEIAHDVRDSRALAAASELSERYDLIVVGGGISGLSAAHFYRKQTGPSAKILILDNHDDFGGHAKRNEFWHDGRMYLMNGGTLNVEAPSQYSTVAAGLLWELGIDRTRYFESIKGVTGRYRELGLSRGMFFDQETFGEDRLVAGYSDKGMKPFLAASPLSATVRKDILELYENTTGTTDTMPGLSSDEKKKKLAYLSYRDYLIDVIGVDPGVVPFFNTRPMGLFCVGIDAVPALYGWEMGYPGFRRARPRRDTGRSAGARAGRPTRPGELGARRERRSGYVLPRRQRHHRAASRAPTHPGSGARPFDGRHHHVPRRLRAPRSRRHARAHPLEQLGRESGAHERAGSRGQLRTVRRVRGGACVLACWNGMIPYICDEVPEGQRKALLDGVKAPLVYTSVLVANWKAFAEAGVSSVTAPGSYHTSLGLGPSLELGEFRTSQSPDEPIVVRMSRYPCSPGLTRREQHRVGQSELLATTFETFEHNIRDQLARTFGPTGFDAARDILAIAVNRWPHGYTYTYNTLFDPEPWAFTTTSERPAIRGRQPIGSRITIANADAAASPHTDAAINEAYRAVTELERAT